MLDVSRELGLPPGRAHGVAALADVLVDRGELDEADRLFADAGLEGALHGTDTDQPSSSPAAVCVRAGPPARGAR